MFIGGIIIIEAQEALRPVFGTPPTGGGLGMGRSQSSILDVFSCLGRWTMYASLPVLLLACTGATRAFAQCSRCGYDLTGNDSGVCPECGGQLREE